MNNLRCWILGFLLASFATGLSAQTIPFCDHLDQAMADAKEDSLNAKNGKTILQGLGPLQASCAFSVDLSGAKSVTCNWAFPYRTEEATEVFVEMLSALSVCADPTFGVIADQKVNHPDFYDLRLLRVAGGKVGLSLKDKAELQQTYVFLRITPSQ